jgi:DNA processing protein
MMSNKKIQLVKVGNRTLHALGNVDLLNGPCVSVAGSREIESNSSEWLQDIISQCGRNAIVSGLARGTDTVAHEASIKYHKPTIAVLPSGLKNIYPKQNRGLARQIVNNGGLLLSEYPNNSFINRERFIARNKIIAELGNMLIMPQCDEHSGTMHTVRFAQQLNKCIVLPDSDYSGNQYIIGNNSFRSIIKN